MNNDEMKHDARSPRIIGTLTGWEDVIFELDDLADEREPGGHSDFSTAAIAP